MFDPKNIGVGKFGRNADLDTGAAEDIWSYGGAYTFTSAAVAYHISSSDNADTMDVRIIGLDADGAEQIVDMTLVGQTETPIPGVTWLRVYRAYVLGAAASAGDIYIYEDDTVVAGVPQTAAKVRAKIDQTAQQTLMAITSVPSSVGGRTIRKAYIADLLVATMAGTAATTKLSFNLLVRAPGGTWLTKSTFGINSDASATIYRPFAKYIEVAPGSDIRVSATTDKDNADVTAEFTVFYEFE